MFAKGTIYLDRRVDLRHPRWVNRSASCGGGDQGGFVENPARPKPQGVLVYLVLSWRNPRAEVNHKREDLMEKGDPESSRGRQGKRPVQSAEENSAAQVHTRNWAIEVYHEQGPDARMGGDYADILEFDLEEEEAKMPQKFLAIAIYYSSKSFNVQFLFSDMLHAWGIARLPQIEKLEDYSFKLEFNNEDLKRRVVEGGSW
jgi:hypothetical protein